MFALEQVGGASIISLLSSFVFSVPPPRRPATATIIRPICSSILALH